MLKYLFCRGLCLIDPLVRGLVHLDWYWGGSHAIWSAVFEVEMGLDMVGGFGGGRIGGRLYGCSII